MSDEDRSQSVPEVAVRIVAEPGPSPLLRDMAALITDLNLLYELNWVAVERPAYFDNPYSPWLLARDARPIPRGGKLRVEALRLESPLWIRLLVPAAPAALLAALGMARALVRVQNVELRIPPELSRLADAASERLELENAERRIAIEERAYPRSGRRATHATTIVENRLHRSIPLSLVAFEEKDS